MIPALSPELSFFTKYLNPATDHFVGSKIPENVFRSQLRHALSVDLADCWLQVAHTIRESLVGSTCWVSTMKEGLFGGSGRIKCIWNFRLHVILAGQE